MAQAPVSPRGFDYTRHARVLCADMTSRLPELEHIDLDRVAVAVTQARASGRYGVQATLTPMRFEGGATTGERNGRRYTAQQLLDEEGRELLYILTLFLPRFQNQSLAEKINTMLHELWHISPACDGDLRRFAGRCYAHGRSQKEYDAQVDQLARRWWADRPPASLYEFLRLDFRQLRKRHGAIYGVRIPHPKLIPIDGAA
jgi:hypothetical protein